LIKKINYIIIRKTVSQSHPELLNVKKIVLYIIFILCILLACKKGDYYQKDSELLTFLSLTSEKDSVHFGESTRITAEVGGRGVSYKWYADRGVIQGSGNQITFIATCTCRFNDVSCTAVAENKSVTKTVTIIIY
jgi:hypothetical protein